jgi:hypothetical protein
MRDVMLRMSKHRGRKPVTRPTTYTMPDGTVVEVPATGPFPVGMLLPRHKGDRSEVYAGCGCAECQAVGFTATQRAEAAQGLYAVSQARVIADHATKEVRRRERPSTVLRRKAVA